MGNLGGKNVALGRVGQVFILSSEVSLKEEGTCMQYIPVSW